MNALRLCREISRVFRARATWLFIAAFAIVPFVLSSDMFGLGTRYFQGTMTDVFMFNPARLSVMFGAAAALIMTLAGMYPVMGRSARVLVEAVSNPIGNALRTVFALICAALTGIFLALAALLPFTVLTMGGIFSLRAFLVCWGLLYGGAVITVILFTSGLLLLMENMGVTFIMAGGLISMGLFSSYGQNFLLAWVRLSPYIYSMSDATGNYAVTDVFLYTRLLWFAAALGVFFLGLLFARRHGKGPVGSFCVNAPKFLAPAALCGAAAVLLVLSQPFTDNGLPLRHTAEIDPDTGYTVYTTDDSSFTLDDSHNPKITLRGAEAEVKIDTRARRLFGVLTCRATNSTGEPQDLPVTLCTGIEITAVYWDDEPLRFTKNAYDNFQESVYHIQLHGQSGELRIEYGGYPRNRQDHPTLTYGIAKRFVFINGLHPDPKCTVSGVTVTAYVPDDLTAYAPYDSLRETESDLPGYNAYQFISRYPSWFFAGAYNVDKLNAGGLDIEFAYFAAKSRIIEDSGARDIIEDAVNFFTEKFGPLRFDGQPLIIAELDAVIGGGWAIQNMSVMGETMFAGGAYQSDPMYANIEGGSGLGVMVHEIAHQWWGWGPDGVWLAEDGQSPWSAEGLTCYSVYLYMKSRTGEEYARKEFTDAWRRDAQTMQNSFYLLNTQFTSALPANFASNVYGEFSGVTKYSLMPALLMKAEALVGGEDAFCERLRELHDKYGGSYAMVNYDVFLDFIGVDRGELNLE